MQRYFINEDQIKNENNELLVYIDEADSHHIKDVMRMHLNEKVIVCIENKTNYLCEIILLSKKVVLRVIEELNENNELNINVTIAHGLVRKDKQEEVIRRLTELGCFAYLPVMMDRSIIKLNNKELKFKNERLERIVKEATEQSERNKKMLLLDVIAFNDLIKIFPNYDLVLFASVSEKNDLSLKEKLNIKENTKNILVIIGPEGGFSDSEIEKIKKTSAYTISLGKRVLRTETAPLCAMSILAYEGEK